MSKSYKILRYCYKYHQISLKTGKEKLPSRTEVESKFGKYLLSDMIYYDYLEDLGEYGGSSLKITMPGIQEYHRMRRDFLLTVIAIASLAAALYPILSDAFPMIQFFLLKLCFQA